MLVKEVHSQKAVSPLYVTLLGIVILVRDLQPLNAQVPIDVTLSGRETFVKEE